MPFRRASRAAAVLLVLLVAGACGGEGEGGEGSRPTISPTRTPTATLPSPTGSPDASNSPELPSPTRTPSETNNPEPTNPELTSPTPTPDESESPTLPSPTRTPTADEAPEETPTEAESEPVPTTEPVPPASSDEVEDATAEDEAVPSWVWWLLALLLVGAAVGVPLVVRSRRRRGWRQELASVESEVAWFARGLLPELRRVGSLEQLAGGWTVGRPRVAAAEDRLTGLESTAPDELDRDRARSLRDAVRLARERVQQLSGPGPHDTWALDLDAVMADLEVVLGADTPQRPRDGAG